MNCVICKADTHLTLDHLIPRKWCLDGNETQVLCSDCHWSKFRLEQKLMASARREGVDYYEKADELRATHKDWVIKDRRVMPYCLCPECGIKRMQIKRRLGRDEYNKLISEKGYEVLNQLEVDRCL